MYECDFTVQYTDIDSKNKMSNYGFFKLLQEAGCLHADKCGYGLKDIPNTKIAWIILDWKLKIYSRPCWNSKVHLKTWPSKMDLASCFREYTVLDEVGNTVAVATSRWALLNVDTGHLDKVTPEIKELFAPIQDSLLDTGIEKLRDPENYDLYFPYTILRRDIDTNHHLNNLNYIFLAAEALPNDVYDIDFSNIEVTYKHQCLLGDKVVCCYKKINEHEHVVAIKSADESILHAIVRFGS